MTKLDQIRNFKPANPDHLHNWIRGYTGARIAREKVCRNHQSPFESTCCQYFERPDLLLELGPRGGGKSYRSAIETHLVSRFNKSVGTRILGGSLAQSEQIYKALGSILLDGNGPCGSDADTVQQLLKTMCNYKNGSDVSMLAASVTSVRGPHIPSLKLDEVDEIDPELRNDALGMCMGKGALSASILMTSTWHRVGGPMSQLIEQANAGDFKLFTFCIFEVMERCPTSRSGVWVG